MDIIIVFMIIILAILLVIGYLASTAILTGVIKLFKIENASFKKSLVIILFLFFAGLIINTVERITNLGVISNIFSVVITFFIFYFLLKKYYQIDWKKSLGIYVVFYGIMIILELVTVIPIRSYVAQPFFVSGNSMSPNFNANDYLLIGIFDKQLVHGDVVVYRNPKDINQFLIKRIIGLPNEKVEIKNGQISINGQVLKETYAVKGETLGETSLLLKNDEYFVLGDNRGGSLDSRLHGPIKKNLIVGKIIYNFKQIFATQSN